jgi:hypothetical protein
LFCTLTYHGQNPELKKNDVQNFFKRLRLTHKFSYYAVAEYGSITGRPHYHILIFGLNNNRINLQKFWQYGFVSQSIITTATIRYCTNYATKKTVWRLTSRRPALGLKYFQSDKFADELNRFHGCINYNFRVQSLPRYYKKKLGYNTDYYNWQLTKQRMNIEGQIKWLEKNKNQNYSNFLLLHKDAKKQLEKEKIWYSQNQIYYPL